MHSKDDSSDSLEIYIEGKPTSSTNEIIFWEFKIFAEIFLFSKQGTMIIKRQVSISNSFILVNIFLSLPTISIMILDTNMMDHLQVGAGLNSTNGLS